MKRKTLFILLAILSVSVILRVAVAFYLGNKIDAPPLLTDQRSYDALGARLIAGYGFSFDRGWYPFTPANSPTAHWSFLYSLFVAAMYAIFGPNPLSVRVVQAILGGILLPWMVYRFTWRLCRATATNPLGVQIAQRGGDEETISLLAAGGAAIYFYFVLYAATLMTETFFIVALLWILEQSIGVSQQPTLRRGLQLGVGLGIAALLRQSILPWVAVLAMWLLWTGWRSHLLQPMLKVLVVAVGLLGLAILPFTIRNYTVYHELLLLNSNAGYAMYSAQHPQHGVAFQAYTGMPIPDGLNGLNEAQLDRELMRRGIQFVLDDPGRYILLSISRASSYFEFWPSPDTSAINNIGRVGSIGLFLPFMIYGLYLALRWAGPRALHSWVRFSTTPLALVVLFMAFYSLLHIMTWAMPRYRLPVDAVALPFAALGITRLAQKIAKARR